MYWNLEENCAFPFLVTQRSTSTSSGMTEDVDLKGHALNVPSKTSQIDRAAKLVKLNDGRATPLQAVNVISPMSAPLQSSGIPGRQPPRTEEIPDTGKTQVLNFCMMHLSNPSLFKLYYFYLTCL